MTSVEFDINTLGTIETFSNGMLVYRNKQGRIHRNDGPAIVYPNGFGRWYRHGKQHRRDGPAEIEPGISESWYYKGKLHRDDGPAKIVFNSVEYWYQYDKLHREDGPAVIYATGHLSWYLHDRMIYTAKEFQQRSRCTDEELAFLVLKYGQLK